MARVLFLVAAVSLTTVVKAVQQKHDASFQLEADGVPGVWGFSCPYETSGCDELEVMGSSSKEANGIYMRSHDDCSTHKDYPLKPYEWIAGHTLWEAYRHESGNTVIAVNHGSWSSPGGKWYIATNRSSTLRWSWMNTSHPYELSLASNVRGSEWEILFRKDGDTPMGDDAWEPKPGNFGNALAIRCARRAVAHEMVAKLYEENSSSQPSLLQRMRHQQHLKQPVDEKKASRGDEEQRAFVGSLVARRLGSSSQSSSTTLSRTLEMKKGVPDVNIEIPEQPICAERLVVASAPQEAKRASFVSSVRPYTVNFPIVEHGVNVNITNTFASTKIYHTGYFGSCFRLKESQDPSPCEPTIREAPDNSARCDDPNCRYIQCGESGYREVKPYSTPGVVTSGVSARTHKAVSVDCEALCRRDNRCTAWRTEIYEARGDTPEYTTCKLSFNQRPYRPLPPKDTGLATGKTAHVFGTRATVDAFVESAEDVERQYAVQIAHEKASKTCQARGQYLCNARQTCGYKADEKRAQADPKTFEAWTAISSPGLVRYGDPVSVSFARGKFPDGQVLESECLARAMDQYGFSLVGLPGEPSNWDEIKGKPGFPQLAQGVKGGWWNHVPTGCSVQASSGRVHYNRRQGKGDKAGYLRVNPLSTPPKGACGIGGCRVLTLGSKGSSGESDCLAAAVNEFGEAVTKAGALKVSSREGWGHVPGGCSIQKGSFRAHYNRRLNANDGRGDRDYIRVEPELTVGPGGEEPLEFILEKKDDRTDAGCVQYHDQVVLAVNGSRFLDYENKHTGITMLNNNGVRQSWHIRPPPGTAKTGCVAYGDEWSLAISAEPGENQCGAYGCRVLYIELNGEGASLRIGHGKAEQTFKFNFNRDPDSGIKPTGQWLYVGPGAGCGEKSLFDPSDGTSMIARFRADGTRIVPRTDARFDPDALFFSCCGSTYPGATQSFTKLFPVVLRDASGQPEPTDKVTWEWDARLQKTRSVTTGLTTAYVYVSAEFALEASLEAGCNIETAMCSAAVSAAVRVTLKNEAGFSSSLGGVPILGKVSMESTAFAEGEVHASAGARGIAAGASAVAGASVTYAAEIRGEIANGYAISAQGEVTTGLEATAEGSVSLTLSEVSFEAEAGVVFGTEVEGSVSSETQFGSGTIGAAGCSGCVGAGFSPAFGVTGCGVSVGAEGSAALAAGVTFEGEIGINVCNIGEAIADITQDIGEWGRDLSQDTAQGVIEGYEAVSSAARDIGGEVSSGVKDISKKVSRGTINVVNNVGKALNSGNQAIQNGLEDVSRKLANQFRRFKRIFRGWG